MFQPKFTVTSTLLNQITEIAQIKTLVERSKLLPTREAFLRRQAVIKMAHTSTSIEGNTLNEYQVQQLAAGKPIRAEARQILEVKNYLSSLKKIDKLALQSSFGTKDVLDIHKTVISGLVDSQKVGAFRPGPVYIVNVLKNGTEQVAYTPPVSNQVPLLIEELLNWLKTSSDHPIIRAGLFHYQFETIHPFTDGNGRVGRLLTLLHLYQSGWDFRKVLVLEDYYNRNRKNYYKSLQTGTDYPSRKQANLTPWLEYFVTGFLDEAKIVKDQVIALQHIGESALTQTTLDPEELQIIDFATTTGKITTSDVIDILRVPQRTAQAKLKRLRELKILQIQGAGPSTYYVINQN